MVTDSKKLKTVCAHDMCSGCMACIAVCTKDAIRIDDSLRAYNAVINDRCVECGGCYKVCTQNNPSTVSTPIAWYQGWAKDENLRRIGSSGGCASAIAKAFVEHGNFVCSCAFFDGVFGFNIANTSAELNRFAGSKYVKSNPAGIYFQVKKLLRDGERVLYIALPCQVAAIKKYVGEELQDNLYTIDLICHGTPSPKILHKFLGQYNVSLNDIYNIEFRSKLLFSDTTNDYNSFASNGTVDKYMLSFLYCLTFTNNCYMCQYAKVGRVSDLSLGDSWGSSLTIGEADKGISLLLSQSEKGNELLSIADVVINSVDLNEAVSHNAQLMHPSERPAKWSRFFDCIINGKSFNSCVSSCLLEACFRQVIKRFCIILGIKKVTGLNYRISYIRK